MSLQHGDDPSALLRAVGDRLVADPVRNNLLVSIVRRRRADGVAGDYWWGELDGSPTVAVRAPRHMAVVVSPHTAAAPERLAAFVHADAPDAAGVFSDAATAAAFAGAWTELSGSGARPAEGQRLYRLREVVAPRPVGGSLRPATDADRPLLASWLAAFHRETGGVAEGEPAVDVARLVGAGFLWVWERGGEVVSMTGSVPPVEGVARVGPVFTPPEARGHGFASACVAAVSRLLADRGHVCILHTQLENATSNGIYRAIGYEPIAEMLRYAFDAPA